VFLGVLALVTIGITASARVQVVLTALELAAMALVGVVAILHARAAPAAVFSWDWFSPTAFGSLNAFTAGMLVAIFYFLGWDVSANLAEETADAKRASGFGGVAGVLVIFLLFLLMQVSVQMSLSPEAIQDNSANVLSALGHVAFPGRWSAIATIAVLVSAIATLETQLLQCTRLLFSMARDGVISAPMGRLHPKFQTPWLAGFVVGGVTLLLFIASATAPSITQLMSELISSIGVQAAFYYACAAFACFWYYRKAMLSDWRMLAFAGFVPLASGLFVSAVGLFQLQQLGWRISAMSVGAVLIGFAPLFYYRKLYRSRFYADPPECFSPER
jgi:amino acid transporter